jgi:hypothetical protein
MTRKFTPPSTFVAPATTWGPLWSAALAGVLGACATEPPSAGPSVNGGAQTVAQTEVLDKTINTSFGDCRQRCDNTYTVLGRGQRSGAMGFFFFNNLNKAQTLVLRPSKQGAETLECVADYADGTSESLGFHDGPEGEPATYYRYCDPSDRRGTTFEKDMFLFYENPDRSVVASRFVFPVYGSVNEEKIATLQAAAAKYGRGLELHVRGKGRQEECQYTPSELCIQDIDGPAGAERLRANTICAPDGFFGRIRYNDDGSLTGNANLTDDEANKTNSIALNEEIAVCRASSVQATQRRANYVFPEWTSEVPQVDRAILLGIINSAVGPSDTPVVDSELIVLEIANANDSRLRSDTICKDDEAFRGRIWVRSDGTTSVDYDVDPRPNEHGRPTNPNVGFSMLVGSDIAICMPF